MRNPAEAAPASIHPSKKNKKQVTRNRRAGIKKALQYKLQDFYN
jgi:hypothetical protein